MSMTDEPLILVLDEGTTSTRAILFDHRLDKLATAQQDIVQHYPRPGWVEHDAEEIWARPLAFHPIQARLRSMR